MRIIVCVKQVPGSSDVKVDEKTGLLIRPKKGNKLNPYDLFAIETALELKERQGGSVTALTMGPPQAEAALSESVAMGCDGGVLLSDRAFGGADVLATSYAIAQGVKKIGDYDLILCGKQTTDGDTAQVGAELAEHLGIPHLSNVCSVESVENDRIIVRAYQENLVVTEELTLPCLICLDAEINTPRLPSYRRMKDNVFKATVYQASDMEDTDASHYGLKGSPTQVQKVFPPEKNEERKMLDGTGKELANALFDMLIERKLV